jgi:hypothetical protein
MKFKAKSLSNDENEKKNYKEFKKRPNLNRFNHRN